MFENKAVTSSTVKGQSGIFQRFIARPIGGELLPAQQAARLDTSTAWLTKVRSRRGFDLLLKINK